MPRSEYLPKRKALAIATSAMVASCISNTAIATSCTVMDVTTDCYLVSAPGYIGVGIPNVTLSSIAYGVFNAMQLQSISLDQGSRISLLFSAVANQGTLGLLENSGYSSGDQAGFLNIGYTGEVQNNATGTVAGRYGVQNGVLENMGATGYTGTIGTIQNDGTISGTISAIYNEYAIDSINNTNLISGTGSGIDNGGSIGTITNSGLIQGGGVAISVGQFGSIGWLINAGTISGDTSGIQNRGTITEISNRGRITHASTSGAGVYNAGVIGSLSNSGFITSVLNAGTITQTSTLSSAVMNTGTISTLTNSGTISGAYAIGVDGSGTIGALINSGLISGSAVAIFNVGSIAGSLFTTIANTGVIAGSISNHSISDMTISGGTSIFGTLTGYGGSPGTPDPVGLIDSRASNLTLSGNLLLNDNVMTGTLVNTAGVLQVNNPITITGNYNQHSDATLLIGVSNGASANGLTTDTGYGRLVVSGNATIDPGASVQLTSTGTGATYGFAPGQRFVVMQAPTAATVNYNAGSLNYGIRGARYAVTGAEVRDAATGTDNLVVTVGEELPDPTAPTDPGTGTTPSNPPQTSTPNPPAAPAPIRPTMRNAVASFGGLQNYTGISDPGLLGLYNASLAIGSVSEANRAGSQLSPAQQLAASRAAAAPTLNALALTGARADALRLAQSGHSGVATGDGGPTFGVWGQAFGGHASQGMVDDISGYSANYGGLMLGVDRALGDKWLAGGAFSFSHTKINGSDDNSGSSTQVNGYGLLAYASYLGSPWYVNLSGGIVQQRYNTTRVVDFTGFSGVASGAFSGQQYVARTEFGYPLALGSGTLTPLASLTYSYLHQGSYTETGGNGAALSVGTSHASSLRSALGARLERAFATRYGDIVPFAQAQWIHEFVNSRAVTGASYAGDFTGETAFTAVGPSPVRDLADLTLGATLVRSSNLSLTARYELQVGSRFVSQTASLRLQQRF
ncbi:autotransporter domain-containing protein [Pandoraea nosoerga]|uniref:Autotransporter domain-containing protein n=2 Tax=Pandoraea nosoerga TaxID=2508296 RepID=A0A5E4SZ73_9BURK|nr:autotransporter domain-containing protein [Pandoraea nosoerga]MBN4665648.1 autotransporter domain-containing protein [Pandoraea nosoerga]MBN4675653.1 autotransporter domain-containing protein [Pandoraea nosoerga]MBN4680964.1 autotransporter domain-containing protein [Pandoraea nosoerga]MBN4744688.1 autotransporter domain-containing protein [Pandoraea nosoerga]VVD79464.1 autotransporter domain-containing protein [Pandoraea nosoerga]